MRHNDALHRDVLYYAVSYPEPRLASPAAGSAKTTYIFRFALPLPDVDQEFSVTRRPVWTAFLILLASAFAVSFVYSRNTSRRIRALNEFVARMAAADFRPISTAPDGDSLEELGTRPQ